MYLFFIIFFQINQISSTNYRIESNLSHIFYYFSNPGNFQFKIPSDVTNFFVKMWGSGGGGSKGGAGGYSEGYFNVTKDEIINIEVGSPNIFMSYNWKPYPAAGSRSSIYRNTILNEIIVAGGGGSGYSSNAGAGGGLIGQSSTGVLNSVPNTCGTRKAYKAGGGTQINGGYAGTADSWDGCYTTGVPGSRNFGSKGWGKLKYYEGGAGGGGYYGGGSGGHTCYAASGGGGGSGFLSSNIFKGITLTGNYNIPANSNDLLRNNAGNPNENGLVILIYSKNQNSKTFQKKNLKFLNLIFPIFISN